MAIVYPLPIPTARTARKVKIRKSSVVGMTVSPFTKGQEVFAHLGEGWEMDVDLPPMGRADAEQWIALQLALNGLEGTFLMGDPATKTPRGNPVGVPVVDGAGQNRFKTLATRGWTPNASGVLLKGDWIQLGSAGTSVLYKSLADVDADATGKAVIDVRSRIKGDLTDGEGVITSNCVGVWRMVSDTEWDVDEALIYGLNFSAIEAQ